MTFKKLLNLAFGIFVLTFLLICSPAQSFERDLPPGYETPEEHPVSIEFSDSEIEAFAQAQNQIIQIQEEYSATIAETTDETKRRDAIETANQEMIGAIEASGLNVELYNEILTEAQNDPELMGRIEETAQEILY